ncbi:hypothetical protein BCR32DRAFT_75899 [Anaeromyces robustus]|uniref:Uncharacterized protein n=1 Tax=Anaeromyces robustus TaxID=1754192 RepID=A0A1Y1WSN5_9FUNG|nr:hypothetical protein BCR32DRAFT_75899 [Anaeromyces robustus]|eukprot:ORX76537.1 hypothetical protein BCR32DRAFT_75899 [Anaeromyces robustus]
MNFENHEAEFKRPTLLIFECIIRNDQEEKVVINALKAATSKMITLENPRKGVPIFAFSKVKDLTKTIRNDNDDDNDEETKNQPRILHFLECYNELDSWLDQLTQEEASIVSDMFIKYINDYIKGTIINPYLSSDTFRVSLIDTLRTMCVIPKYGEVFNIESICNQYVEKLGDKMRPSQSMVEIELLVEPLPTDNNSENLLKVCKELIPASAPLSPWVACIIPNWKFNKFISVKNKININTDENNDNNNDSDKKRIPLQPNELKQFESNYSVNAFVILIITSSPDINLKDIFKKNIVENIIKNTKNHDLNYIAPNLTNEENQNAIDYLKSIGIRIHETREVVAGYLLHPAFAKKWEGNKEQKGTDKSIFLKYTYQKPKSTTTTTTSSSSSQVISSEEKNTENSNSNVNQITKDGILICDHPYFNKRINELTNNIESYIFDKSFMIKNKKGLKKAKVDTIPVLSIVNYFCGFGMNDNEISSQTIFSQLERFRNIKNELEFFNSTTTETIEKNPYISHRINKFTELIGRIGYDITSNQKKFNVKFEGITELIMEIEKDFNHIIQPAREAILNLSFGKINYLGLQELYRIGKNVITTKVGALNGIPVMYRITDAYYEHQRSLFGGKKYNFYLILETVVQVGEEYVCVYFENVLSNWNNEKEIHLLEYQVINNNNNEEEDLSSIPKCIFKYHEILKSLGGFPAYRKYNSNTFIPHQRKSIGGASSMKSLSSDGLMVVDTELGMNMNYHLISNVDKCWRSYFINDA